MSYILDTHAEKCPECGTNWRDGQIPPAFVAADYYGHRTPCRRKQGWDVKKGEVNPECTCGPRYYRRIIGIELPYDDPKHFDGISYWQCPDCGTRWDRFTGHMVSQGSIRS